MSIFEKCRNPGANTYNGVKLIAELSGLSEKWILDEFNRIKALTSEQRAAEQEARDAAMIERIKKVNASH